MKKSLQIFALLFCIIISAQAPEKFSYQAVIRNASNALITNATVGVKISILKTSAAGTVVYAESQTPTTNINGLISVQIGAGTVISGTIAGINWSNDSYYIKTETDPAGGTSYSIAGTTQLLSVPYALYAKKSGSSLTLPYYGASTTDNVYPFIISNSSGTKYPAAYFENTSLTNTAAAVRGINNSTGDFGVGIEGAANSNTNGNVSAGVQGYISGTGNAGAGVYGYAENANAVFGFSQNGYGVRGLATGTGSAAYFQTDGTGNALYTYGPLKLLNIGEGNGKVLTSDGGGKATWQDLILPDVHFSSIGGSNQSIPSGSTATIINSWLGLQESGGANYNPTTGEYTVPVTGTYYITAKIGFYSTNTAANGASSVGIQIDNVSQKTADSNYAVIGEIYADSFVDLQMKLTAGQKIRIRVRQNGNPTNSLYNLGSNFTVKLISK